MKYYSSKLKKQATQLRQNGNSYREISYKLGVPKSTLSYWLKTVPLRKKDRNRLYTNQIKNLSSGPSSQKMRRKKEISTILNDAKKEIGNPLSSDTFKLIGAALYWAEGSKTKIFSMTNSDPVMILFFVKWIERYFSIKPSSLKSRLNFYEQQNEDHLKRFWSDLTGIPLENFTKSYIKRQGKNFKKNNLYYGTIRVTIPRGTNMRYRTFGWIESALQDILNDTDEVTRKWEYLKNTERPVNLPD